MAKAAPKEKKQRKPVDPAVRRRYEEQRIEFEANDAERSKSSPSDHGGPYSSKKSPTILKAFCIWLSKGYSPKFAANKCGINRSTFFKWREEDAEFAAQWKAAVDEGTDFLEDEAMRRAAEGVDRPVFQMGECVGYTREYSDSLMAMQLKGRRPERYGDKVAHTGAEGGAIKHHIEVEFVKPTGEK